MSTPNYPTPHEYDQQRGGSDYNENNPSSRQNYQQGTTTGSQQAYLVMMEEEDVGYIDDEDLKFRDRSARMLFVRKVLVSVGIQLLACAAFTALCMNEPHMRHFFQTDGQVLAYCCSIIWFVLFIAIACCNVGRGKPNPLNISLMVISTILLSVYVAAFVVFFNLPAILIAASTTIGVVLLLALVTFYSKFDITGYIVYVFIAFMALFLFMLIAGILIAFGVIKLSAEAAFIVSMTISAILSVIFAIMILYQLKLIVGGGKQEYGEDDWLIASVTLFYHIIIFFMELLKLTRLMGR